MGLSGSSDKVCFAIERNEQVMLVVAPQKANTITLAVFPAASQNRLLLRFSPDLKRKRKGQDKR